MGVLAILLQILGVVNATVPLMKDAEIAFSEKKGSGKKKKRVVLDSAKALLAGTELTAAQQKAALAEIGKTVDTVATVAKVVNK